MKANERDERQISALERIGAMLARGERRAHDRRQEERFREQKAALPPLRRVFAGERGTKLMITAIPGFLALWEKVVPGRFVDGVCDLQSGREWPLLRCPCGASTVLDEMAPIECVGGCGRWFLWTGDLVRVHNFDPEELAA